jgi:hypothetical protein
LHGGDLSDFARNAPPATEGRWLKWGELCSFCETWREAARMLPSETKTQKNNLKLS